MLQFGVAAVAFGELVWVLGLFVFRVLHGGWGEVWGYIIFIIIGFSDRFVKYDGDNRRL